MALHKLHGERLIGAAAGSTQAITHLIRYAYSTIGISVEYIRNLFGIYGLDFHVLPLHFQGQLSLSDPLSGGAVLPDDSMETCRKHLEPYHPLFWAAFSGAFEQFRKLSPDHQAVLSGTKRAKATVIWAFAMHEAARLFGSDQGVTAHTKYESTTYEIRSGQILTRLKKVTRKGYSRNIPTARALGYFAVGQFEIFDQMWAVPTRVDVGYVSDNLGQRVEKVLVVARRGMFIKWKYEIARPAEGTRVRPIITPTAPITPTPTRIVAKRTATKRSVKKASGNTPKDSA